MYRQHVAEYSRPWVHEADARFAQRVKAERERRRISQTQLVTALAAKNGIRWHQSTMTKVEAGERPVRLMEALALASVLGMPLDDLLDDPDSEEARRRRSERLRGQHLELFHIQTYIAMRDREIEDELADLGETDEEDEVGPSGQHRSTS